MNTLIIQREETEKKNQGRGLHSDTFVLLEKGPLEKKYWLQKYTDVFPLPYEYVITSILFRMTTVS